MIITRTPLRISFCGGGSDIAAFYREHGGCVLSTSINKYLYISINPYFDRKMTVLKYSKMEIIEDITNIKHEIFKAVLNKYDISGVEITSTADIPAGTGLGSSGAFTVGLLNAIKAYSGKPEIKTKLAELACAIEIDCLKSPIGKQDQYATAIGGLNFMRFNPDGSVSLSPLSIKKEVLKKLESNLIMFYTGKVRNANEILSEQIKNSMQKSKVKNLLKMCELAKTMKDQLENGIVSNFGEIMDESWQLKKTLADGISSDVLNNIYDTALKNGAKGGKLLGAGGAGFFLFYCELEEQAWLRKTLNMQELKFVFEKHGTSIIFKC
jgi:D-glycero-alpha-D-manno-heptose-7-phosphate kinase